jgi:hypothetical protein
VKLMIWKTSFWVNVKHTKIKTDPIERCQYVRVGYRQQFNNRWNHRLEKGKHMIKMNLGQFSVV